MDIAGKDITEALAQEVLKHHLVPDNTLPQIFQSMKEHVCRVAPTSAIEDVPQSDEESRSFELPDGTIIQVPERVRLKASEVLFNAETGVQKLCMQAMQIVNPDCRADLKKTVGNMEFQEWVGLR